MTDNGAPHAFKQADPCSLVVFGASGDLMHRLLFPALYNLAAPRKGIGSIGDV
jgi:glucose-6-phosphate 1-dehydrogenase